MSPCSLWHTWQGTNSNTKVYKLFIHQVIYCIKWQLTNTYTFLKITSESPENHLPANTMHISTFKEKFSCVPMLLTPTIFITRLYNIGYFLSLASRITTLNECPGVRGLCCPTTHCKLPCFTILKTWPVKLGKLCLSVLPETPRKLCS